MQNFFKDKCCVKCGSVEKLELDQIDPKTKIANAVWSWSEKRRLEEISKCQVLCYKCHKEKTKTDFYPPPECGTIRKYQHHGCRCPLCKKANRDRMRKQRNKKFTGA